MVGEYDGLRGRGALRLARYLTSRGVRAVRERGEDHACLPLRRLRERWTELERIHLVCRPATWRTLTTLLDDAPRHPCDPLSGGLVEITLTRMEVIALVQRVARMRWDLWKPQIPQQDAAIRFYRAVDRALEELPRVRGVRGVRGRPLRIVVDDPVPPA